LQRTGRDFQRFNYLGEWHSHPSFSVLPSPEDVGTMIDIVENPRSEITFAVLLIVRLRLRLWIDHSLTIFARGQAPWRARICTALPSRLAVFLMVVSTSSGEPRKRITSSTEKTPLGARLSFTPTV